MRTQKTPCLMWDPTVLQYFCFTVKTVKLHMVSGS